MTTPTFPNACMQVRRTQRGGNAGRYVVTMVQGRTREVVYTDWGLRETIAWVLAHVGQGDTIDLKVTL